MKNLSLQFLQEELKRVSDWIKLSDQKTAFLAVYYSAVAGFAVSQKEEAISKFLSSEGWVLNLLYIDLLLIILTFSFGMYFLFSSIFPRLNNSFTDESLFYFGTISKMKFVDFIKKLGTLSAIESKKQLVEQIYTNSLIADRKMKRVGACIRCLFVLIFLVMIFILM